MQYNSWAQKRHLLDNITTPPKQTWHNIKFLFNININIFRNFVFKININIKILQAIFSISKSISISKFPQPQYQNQYQNFSKPRINIKININIVKILILILKIKILGDLKICFNLFWLMPLGAHGIPPTDTHSPQTWNLGTLFRIKGTQSETHDIPPLAQITIGLILWSHGPTRNLLHLAYDLGDYK